MYRVPSPNRRAGDADNDAVQQDLDGSSSDSDEAEVFGPRHERNYVDPANIPDDPLAYLIIPKELDEHEFEFVFEVSRSSSLPVPRRDPDNKRPLPRRNRPTSKLRI